MTMNGFEKHNVRKGIYILAVPVLVLHTLVLIGCISTSPGVPNIFVGELEYSVPDNLTTLSALSGVSPNSTSRVRFGYFGICTPSNLTTNATYTCLSSMNASPDTIASTLLIPTPFVSYVLKLQHTISFSIPSASGILFLFGLLIISILRFVIESQNKPSSPEKATSLVKRVRNLTSVTRLFLWTSTAVALISAYCVTSTLSALQIATTVPGTTTGNISRGTTLEVLEWVAFGFSALFALCVDIMLHPKGHGNMGKVEGKVISQFKPVSLGGPRYMF